MPVAPALALNGHLDINLLGHHDVFVRTTLTLDREVASRLQGEVRRTGRTFKAVVNDALKRGLGLAAPPTRHKKFRVRARALGFKPGVDVDRLNQLVDELDIEDRTRAR